MYRPIAMCLIVAVGFHLQAQTIAISGKVTDQSGKAVSGALVALKSKDLTATTDASGAYSLSGVISAANNLQIVPGCEAISLMNGVVAVHLAKPAPVGIELFDMRGNLLESVLEKPATAGDYRFVVMKHRFAANMMVIRVSIGQRSTSFRFLPFANGMGAFTPSAISSTPGKKLAKMEAAVDELEVSAAGYTTKKVPITSYEGTVDITLETANCSANPSKAVNTTVSGSGPHKVVVETNSDPGIKCGTIYRPEDIGPGKKYPILVWGEGGCSQDGYSNKAAMGEIASYGYFIIADGTPGSTGSCQGGQNGKAFLDYITWAIAQNKNPCSAYYQSLDTTEIASDGFSCGGLMAINTAGDPRFSAVGYTSSGLFSADQNLWKKIHTPFKIMNGGPSDMAYENGLRDYNGISAIGIPILYFEKTSAGHGGDLFQAKGDFNIVNLAWLNWQLKGDEGATGKALLIGPDCKYCKASGWVFKSANIE